MRCSHEKCSKKSSVKYKISFLDEKENVLKEERKRLCSKHSLRMINEMIRSIEKRR